MSLQDTNEKSKISGLRIAGIAAPSIVIGGALGALIGSALGHVENGIRVGVILGGAAAFTVLQKKRNTPPS